MEIEVLHKDDFSMRLLIQGADVSLMNALRRIILAEVPSMAIDEVVIIDNSSVSQDEVIAHRLGLLPLKTDLDSYNLPEKCQCKSEFGCNLCRISLALNAEATEEARTVYSGELVSENPDILPISEKIQIIKLAKGQKIELEAYARLGKGKNHAKWQPVSLCTYKYLPKIKINIKDCNACGKCVDICPKKVLSKVGKKIEILDLMACTLCKDCMDVCPKKPSAIDITWEKNNFIFFLESTGCLLPERIIIEAISLLNEQFKEFQNQIKGDKK